MISYFLAANGCGALFFGIYLALLKGRSSHTWSRIYLLAATMLALLLPLVKITLPGNPAGSMIDVLRLISLPEISIGAVPVQPGSWYGGLSLIAVVYLHVAGILLLRMLHRIAGLRLFLARQQWQQHEGYRLALNTGIGPASFGATIVFPGSETNYDILQHEKAHLRYGHHYDKLALALLQCFFFPVLPLYFIRRELVLVHEFEADALACTDRERYAYTLLQDHLQTSRFYFLQPFFRHPLKRRIKMLRRNSSGSPNYITKVSVLLCSVLCTGLIVYMQSTAQPRITVLPGVAAAAISPATDDSPVFTSVAQMPEPTVDIPTYLARNLRYPEGARQAGIEGRVVLKFVIDREGKVSEVTLLRDIGGGCGEEAMRVVKSMPAWKPGVHNGKPVKVYYTLPLSFRLQSDRPGKG